jgi:hypothetical protein
MDANSLPREPCGNWWKGAPLGHPEGFGVLTVNAGEIRWSF